MSLFFKLSLRVSASLHFEKKVWRFPIGPHTGSAAPHPRDTFVTIDGQSLVSSTDLLGRSPPHPTPGADLI